MTEPNVDRTVFLDLIVALIAPMFLSVTGGDINHARTAAVATISAYRAETHVDLLTIAQIVAFGIAALGSLSLAMADNLPVSLVIRLRNNAVSASRAGEQCRRTIAAGRVETTSLDPGPSEATIVAQLAQVREKAAARGEPPPPKPKPVSAPVEQQSNEQRHRNAWANAMVDVAAEMAAEMSHLPPSGRQAAAIQAAALGSVADGLFTASVPVLPSSSAHSSHQGPPGP
jgi:hypothetical protein